MGSDGVQVWKVWSQLRYGFFSSVTSILSKSRHIICASQIYSRFLPLQKRKKGSTPAQRKNQISLAATIIEEVLQQIFRFLLVYGTEEADPGFTLFGTYPTGRADLLNVARVCVHWNYAATPLIYTNCEARSATSLKRLHRTLKRSPVLMSHVRTISNIKVSFPASWFSMTYPLLVKDQKSEDALVRLIETLALTEAIELNLEIPESSVPRFFALIATSGAHLTSLHINGDYLLHERRIVAFTPEMCFPFLRSLTLEFVSLRQIFDLPNMPQLRSLCLLASHVATRDPILLFARLPLLMRVEIVTTEFWEGNCMDILNPGQLKTGIQDLTIFESFDNLPDFNLFPPSTIHHYSSLRRLTLAGHGCPVAGLPLAPLSNLEIFTIMQLHRRETINRADESPEPELLFKNLCALLTQAHLTPSLKVVRVRCFRHLWNTTDSAEFETIVKERSLHLEIRMIEASECRLLLCRCIVSNR